MIGWLKMCEVQPLMLLSETRLLVGLYIFIYLFSKFVQSIVQHKVGKVNYKMNKKVRGKKC